MLIRTLKLDYRLATVALATPSPSKRYMALTAYHTECRVSAMLKQVVRVVTAVLRGVRSGKHESDFFLISDMRLSVCPLIHSQTLTG